MASKIPVAEFRRQTQAAKGGARRPAAVGATAAGDQLRGKTEAFFERKEGNFQTKFPRKQHKVTGNTGREAELQDHIRLMEVNFEEVERNLAHCEDRVSELERGNSQLQTENRDVRKQLDSCLLLLAAGNIDPVLGQTIAETEEQNEELRNNVMTVSRALVEELGTFSKNMSTHRQQLQEVMQKTTNLKCNQEQHIVEREQFSLELEEMEKAMECVAALLLDEIAVPARQEKAAGAPEFSCPLTLPSTIKSFLREADVLFRPSFDKFWFPESMTGNMRSAI
ncbi:hypothetical protein GN956_G9992 [Arapaima gigas]